LNRFSRRQDESGDPRAASWMATISGPGIVLYGLTVTFAAIDWIMSLSPDWFSTIFPVIFSLGQILSAMAFAILVATWLAPRRPMSHVLTGLVMRDLGNLLLTFVMLWSYVSFSQFLLIWCGNLPEEIRWYAPRFQGGWQVFGWALVGCQFVLPFVLLLSRDIKQNPRMLFRVAALVLVMRLVDLFWQVVPNFGPDDLSGHALEFVGTVVAVAGVGGVWLAAFVWQLQKMPLLPLHDAELPEFRPEAHHE
jgi:Ni/Fe-hydrogenase subunit HybB-like protein